MKVQLAGPALAAAGQACAACFGGKCGEDPAGLAHSSDLLICPVCNLKQAYPGLVNTCYDYILKWGNWKG